MKILKKEKKHIGRLYAVIIYIIAAAMILQLTGMSVSAAKASDYGLSVTKNKTYNKDGKFWYSVYLTAGDYVGRFTAKLLNPDGGQITSWSEYMIYETTEARSYGYDYSKLPTGKYTLRVTGKIAEDVILDENDELKIVYKSFYWDFAINHTQPVRPAAISLKSEKSVMFEDGTTGHKFTFTQENGKSKKITFEIYDEYGRKIFTKTSGELSYTSGTNQMTWNYYPSSGGLKVAAGQYTIKYWITGSNPKEYVFYIN